MGIVNFSIPKNLVLGIKQEVKIDNFIETGTFKGETTFWAADFFDKVYTIEISPEISRETASKSDCPKNIEFIVGDSREELPQLVKRVKGRSFYWLDGHWCTGAGGKEAECPLMDELKAIAVSEKPIIFIDDARCFLGPLPPPHNCKDWPAIDEIFTFFKENFLNSYTTIIDDVIISVPEDVKPIIDDYWIKTFHKRFDLANSGNVSQKSFTDRLLLKGRAILKESLIKLQSSVGGQKELKKQYTEKYKWITNKNLQTVLDIGANTGQFAEKIRWILPDAKIYSFEPIPFVFDILKKNFENDKNFEAINCGLGEEDGITDFYLNEFSDSSSFLKMKDLHKNNFPQTANESKISVQIKKLDDVLSYDKIKSPYLVKIDVQGFEDKVINGGKNIIRNAEYIITEVSFVELYENQPLFDKIYNLLKEMGFQYVGNFEQLTSYVTNEILQADAIFKKIKE
jgi:FkbM family methyltransferase